MQLKETVIGRLLLYLAVALDCKRHRRTGTRVTSGELGAETGINPTQVRRDLQILGAKAGGKRGGGYYGGTLADALTVLLLPEYETARRIRRRAEQQRALREAALTWIAQESREQR